MTLNRQPSLLSEEDIRTRVVATWLADHGFTAESIFVELSFELRLGRNIYRVGENAPVRSSVRRPRADVLVRSCDGRNLLIVEVKAPDEILNDDAKEQGISYARLLRNGGIAPFVVLTNGRETRIYDSISGELIRDTQVPTNHPHVQNGFRVNVDDIALRAEALETFVSLSSANLLEFCRTQVAYRMQLLRSDDPSSGKKYIPRLYIEREKPKKQLNRLLDKEQRQVVVLVGAPQVGKTNFVCHTVEERLAHGKPCLFYPAIGMQGGLLEEISEDLNWILHDSSATYRIVNKLTRILQRTGQRLVLFIDGWNEVSQQLAQAINHASERLSHDAIQIVISFTNIAARRLLTTYGNPTYISESALINENLVTLLEITPSKLERELEKEVEEIADTSSRHRESLVFIKEYDSREIDKAYQIYSTIFNVHIPDAHHKISSPFLIRIAMEFARDSSLVVIDEPELLLNSIIKKSQRTSDLDQDSLTAFLSELADEMFMNDSPINQVMAKRRWGIPITQELPKGLFESALLAKVYSDYNLPSLDFYNDRERSFAISFLARNWSHKLTNNTEDVLTELSAASRSKVGTEAASWFLRQPKNQNCFQLISQVIKTLPENIKRIVFDAARESIVRSTPSNVDWILELICQGAYEFSILMKAEAAELISVSLKVMFSSEKFEYFLSQLATDQKLIANLLDFDTNQWSERAKNGFFLYNDKIKIVINALNALHMYVCPHGDKPSETTKTLSIVIHNESLITNIQDNAARALGYVDPYVFLRLASTKINTNNFEFKEVNKFLGGVGSALDELEEIYYGSTCPGYLETLSGNLPEDLLYEYERMYEICMPVVNYYIDEQVSAGLLRLLKALKKLVEELEPEDRSPDVDALKSLRCSREDSQDSSVYQLSLPIFPDIIQDETGTDP
jgi:hypothetical protein